MDALQWTERMSSHCTTEFEWDFGESANERGGLSWKKKDREGRRYMHRQYYF